MAFFILSAGFAWVCRNLNPPFSYNDDAYYFLMAQNFQKGDFFSIGYLPGEALFLYLPMKIWSANVVALQLSHLLLAMLTALIVFLVLRRAYAPVAFWATCMFLVTPGFVIHATAMMAEIPFMFLMWVILGLLLECPGIGETRQAWLRVFIAGICCGAALCTKTQAYFLLPGLLLALCAEKKIKNIGVFLTGTALSFAALFPLSKGALKIYTSAAVSTSDEKSLAFIEYLVAWVKNLFSIWRIDLYCLPVAGMEGRTGYVLLIALVVLALTGWFSRLRRPGLLEIVAGVYCLAHLAWPFQMVRYWIPVWPLVLTFLCLGLQILAKAVTVKVKNSTLYFFILCGLFILSCCYTNIRVGQFVSLLERGQKEQKEFYDRVRETAKADDVLSSMFAARTEVRTGCKTLQLPAGHHISQIIRGLAQSPTTIVVVDRSSQPVRSVSGDLNTPYPPGLEYKLEASALFEQIYSGKWGGLYRLRFDKEQFIEAYDLWYRAEQTETPSESLRLVREALSIVPDFPEARALEAKQALLLGQADAPQKLAEYLENNPAYPEYSLALAEMFEKQDNLERARYWTERARKAAEVMRHEAVLQAANLAGERLGRSNR